MYDERPQDTSLGLRDPLSGPADAPAAPLAFPSTLLSWGSGLAAVLVLAALEVFPAWHPERRVALLAAGLATLLAAAVGRAGSRRAGALFPRVWVLAVVGLSALTTSGLALGGDALHGPLASLALALFAASVSLLLRLRRHSPRLEPRGSASLVLLGPILGIWAAVGLRTLGTATLEMLTVGRLPLEALALETQPRTPDEAGRREHARLCHELEDAWGRDLAPLVRGLEIERLDTLESLGRRLAATPGVWASAETSAEVRAACLPAASLLGGAVATAPTPVSLVRTVFEHPSRPEGAGELARDLLRDPRHACRLHRVSTSTVRELSARLEEAAPQAAADLRHALEERRSRLEQSWLEGWLLRCGVRSPAEHPGLPAVEVRLTAPPGLEAGRPDLWLGLPRAAAAKLAENLAACSLRPPHDGRQRRWQAFDCVLLGRSSRDGELAILAELGLVYASNPREKAEDPLQAIPAGSRPQTLRLLLDAEGSGDLHARATASLRSFGRALTAAGGGLEPPPGIDPGDSSGWRFGLRSGADRLEGTISKRILPGGREGMLFVLRRPGGVP